MHNPLMNPHDDAVVISETKVGRGEGLAGEAPSAARDLLGGQFLLRDVEEHRPWRTLSFSRWPMGLLRRGPGREAVGSGVWADRLPARCAGPAPTPDF